MHKFTVGIFATVNEEFLCSCHILFTIFVLPNLISASTFNIIITPTPTWSNASVVIVAPTKLDV